MNFANAFKNHSRYKQRVMGDGCRLLTRLVPDFLSLPRTESQKAVSKNRTPESILSQFLPRKPNHRE
ncbi:hypothetical protein VTH06DRAFT_8385 [Thermothelomyces fergusii]